MRDPEPHRLADYTTDRRVLILSLLAAVIGGVSVVVAYVLIWLIGVITNLCYFGRFSSQFVSPAASHPGPWTILIPAGGGLIIGLMARFGSEKIRGHGIPEALEAILLGRSRMEPRVAFLKPVSSAISIGTGGPFGAEGPIIMTGGALGSLIAQSFHLSSSERKTLLTAGAAGGMAAIFSTPVAAVLLAVELLLFEWKPRSLIPVAAAAAVAGGLRMYVLGPGPIFPVAVSAVPDAKVLAVALLVGISAGFASGALTTMVYFFEDFFGHIPIHWMWWPALGGIFVGIGGLINPHVLGVGYDTIHALLRGELVGPALVSLLIVKAVVWSLSLGSGTSGGVLAPLLIVGGALGALEAHVIPVGNTGTWAIIGMAAMMGGSLRSPFTAIIFTLELTHDTNLLPALLLGTIAAEAVTVLLLPRSILTEKVARRGHHITMEYSVDPTKILRISEIMDTNVPTLPSETKVADVIEQMTKGELPFMGHQGAVLIDELKQPVGILTYGDILRAMEGRRGGLVTVRQAGSQDLVVAYPDELVHDGIVKMLHSDVGRLPVVAREVPHEVVGFVTRADMMKSRVQPLEEESLRETTWKLGG